MTGSEWTMQMARKHFDELIDRALSQGPQYIQSPHGAVVVIGKADYDKLMRRPLPPEREMP